jgi:hypothetical protein
MSHREPRRGGGMDCSHAVANELDRRALGDVRRQWSNSSSPGSLGRDASPPRRRDAAEAIEVRLAGRYALNPPVAI